MITKFRAAVSLVRDRRAVTALEYGMIAALIAVVVIGSLSAVGTNIATSFTTVANATK